MMMDDFLLECEEGVRSSAILGRLYDLKRLKSGVPSPLMSDGKLQVEAFRRKVNEYLATWDSRILGRYKRAIYMPYEGCFYRPGLAIAATGG